MKYRLPRKLKKKVKKAMAVLKANDKVLRRAYWDQFNFGVSGVHYDKKTGAMKNVPIWEVLTLIDK